jgi:hypothetical protein
VLGLLFILIQFIAFLVFVYYGYRAITNWRENRRKLLFLILLQVYLVYDFWGIAWLVGDRYCTKTYNNITIHKKVIRNAYINDFANTEITCPSWIENAELAHCTIDSSNQIIKSHWRENISLRLIVRNHSHWDLVKRELLATRKYVTQNFGLIAGEIIGGDRYMFEAYQICDHVQGYLVVPDLFKPARAHAG